MRRVHLCDPQLRGQGGHYLSHDAQLVRELARRGVPVSIYARKGCALACEDIVPAGAFSLDIFQEIDNADPETWPIENFEVLNRMFAAELLRIPPDQFHADDLVYFPNLIHNQLQGVALWLERLPAERRPAVAVMLRFLNHRMECFRARRNSESIPLYYRHAARMLARAQPRSFLCADTRELAEAYQAITGRPVLELPNPMDLSRLDIEPAFPPDAARPTVAYLGTTSALRGFHLLPAIIERCLAQRPRPRFLVQVQSGQKARHFGLGAALDGLDRLSGDDVQLVSEALDAATYQGLLAAADIVLLPYAPEFYGHGSSGVFTEAASLGKVVVMTKGTMAARQAREYGLGAVEAEAWTVPALAEAVSQAARRLEELRERSAAAAPRFRTENSARALWDKLLGAAFPEAASAAHGAEAAPAAVLAGT